MNAALLSIRDFKQTNKQKNLQIWAIYSLYLNNLIRSKQNKKASCQIQTVDVQSVQTKVGLTSTLKFTTGCAEW